MNDEEKQSIQRELEHEKRFLERQKLMKRLWRLSRSSASGQPETNAAQDMPNKND